MSAQFESAAIPPPAADPLASDVDAIGRIDVIPSILEVVCRTTGMGFAAVARVTEERWVACAVRDEIQFGLEPGDELEVQTTICDEIRASGQAVVIDHVAADPHFSGHHTPAKYGFQSYISVPIIHRGAFFGTLCAIDPRPAQLNTPQTVGMFKLFADLIARHLDTQDQLTRSQAALLGEREAAELREQFIAVLGHDLRNPLASIDAGGRLLLKTPLNPKAVSIVGMVQTSVRRMAELIDNVLDLARGRLGEGIDLRLRAETDLGAAIAHVVDELKTAHPDRRIDTEIAEIPTVACDRGRIAQLVSNLVGNAVTHGSGEALVRVRAHAGSGQLEISVSNGGAPIPDDVRERLFLPFSRAGGQSKAQGLGLGLYIASEIARAHGGRLEVVTGPDRTEFSFRMPLGLVALRPPPSSAAATPTEAAPPFRD